MHANAKRLLKVEQGCRQQSRLRVRLPAIVTTSDGTRRVTLDDVSIRGARIIGDRDVHVGQQAVIQWDRFGFVGEVRWIRDGLCGLAFVRSIPVGDLVATRDLHERPPLAVERDLVRRTADAFVNGCLRL